MNMKKEYDLTIAGAGPSGLMAAVTAAKEGLEVAFIERKTEITSIRRSCCSALINEPGTHEEFVTLENKKIIFHRTDFSVPYNGPFIPLKQLIKFSPKGHKFVVERSEDPVAIALNKECLLEGLLNEAKELGVEILNETQALKAENRDNKVVVTVKQKDQTFEMTSKTAIAADGVNSRIVENLGLNKNRKYFGIRRNLFDGIINLIIKWYEFFESIRILLGEYICFHTYTEILRLVVFRKFNCTVQINPFVFFI